MKDSIHTIIYSVVMGVVCAALLTGASAYTKPYYEANKLAEKQRNVLTVLQVPFDPNISALELGDVYAANVQETERDGLKMSSYVPEGTEDVKAVAVEFAGPGLWGPIKGFLSLDPGMRNILGITFHEQEETPGLGGEIGADWFQDQFKGKSIVGVDGKPGVVVLRGGKAEAKNEVDGITGATMTCDKVEEMLNKTIQKIVKEHN